MKKHIKKCIAFALIVTIFSFTATALAYNRLGTGKISGGATGILYYIDSSASEYDESIRYGIQHWNGISDNIEVNRTTTKSYSRCDNYWGAYFPSNSGIIAKTYLILNNVVITDYDVDWYWCKIKYSSYVFNYDYLDYKHRKGVACHEYGHFLGLAHNYASIHNIMWPYGNTCDEEYPSTDDKNGVISIYGS
ncbi:MAG: matrixin family metalloprotease [Bacillota bacterium]|nr:matrixin family metalloprotease [Bacillota bacterium]